MLTVAAYDSTTRRQLRAVSEDRLRFRDGFLPLGSVSAVMVGFSLSGSANSENKEQKVTRTLA